MLEGFASIRALISVQQQAKRESEREPLHSALMTEPARKRWTEMNRKYSISIRTRYPIALWYPHMPSLFSCSLAVLRHPGCDCTKGFHGPHCEFLDTAALTTSNTQSQQNSLDQSQGLVIALAVALVMLVGGALILNRFSKGKEEDSGGKEDPTADTDAGMREETVDMQSPTASSLPPMLDQDLQTVEII